MLLHAKRAARVDEEGYIVASMHCQGIAAFPNGGGAVKCVIYFLSQRSTGNTGGNKV